MDWDRFWEILSSADIAHDSHRSFCLCLFLLERISASSVLVVTGFHVGLDWSDVESSRTIWAFHFTSLVEGSLGDLVVLVESFLGKSGLGKELKVMGLTSSNSAGHAGTLRLIPYCSDSALNFSAHFSKWISREDFIKPQPLELWRSTICDKW